MTNQHTSLSVGRSGEGEALAESLSDEAIIVGFGWFSFGAKASVTSNPPHANMQARQAALDELLAAGLITHEHEYHKRYRIDRHHFKGTRELQEVFSTERAQTVLKNALRAQATNNIISEETGR